MYDRHSINLLMLKLHSESCACWSLEVNTTEAASLCLVFCLLLLGIHTSFVKYNLHKKRKNMCFLFFPALQNDTNIFQIGELMWYAETGWRSEVWLWACYIRAFFSVHFSEKMIHNTRSHRNCIFILDSKLYNQYKLILHLLNFWNCYL